MDNADSAAQSPKHEPARETEAVLLEARALALADLQSTAMATPLTVTALEDAVANRRWWLEHWPDGATYVAGLVAQDLQDALFDQVGRWPVCPLGGPQCEAEHTLHIHPELGGPEPSWVCEETGTEIAKLGRLVPADGPTGRV